AACGVAVLPKDRTASSTDSPQLSERSAQRAVSSAANPAGGPTQVAPQRSEGVAGIRARFFAYFLAARQESRSAAGPKPGLEKQPPGRVKKQETPVNPTGVFSLQTHGSPT
ncbi:hypothetical protein, partial [Delftia sp. JD2]|uniref:hypothetical protein n=1 Tax=Delftia sp. JD2 TaxID=469553 RepID=UPI001C304D75